MRSSAAASRLRRVRDLAARRDARRGDHGARHGSRIPSRRGDRGHAIRQRRMRSRATATAIRARFPAWPRERRFAPVRRVRSSRPCATAAPTEPSWSSSDVEELRGRCGWDESFSRHRVARCRPPTADSTSTVARFGTCSSPPAIRARACRASSRTTAHRPRVRAARLRRPRRGRGSRDGRGDRVAQCAERRSRGRVGEAPRAGAPAAQRATPALLEGRAGLIPRLRATGANEAAHALRRAVLPTRTRVGRADRARGARRAVPDRPVGRRRSTGHLRDGFRRGFEHDPLLRDRSCTTTGSTPSGAGSCSPRTPRSRRSRTGCGRSRSQGPRLSGRIPPRTRSSG